MSQKNDNTQPPQKLNIMAEPGKTEKRVITEAALEGCANHAVVIASYTKRNFGELDLTETLAVLRDNAKTVQDGSLAQAEKLLISQAMALDSIFANLCLRANDNMGKYLDASMKYLNMALKAQSQTRATLQALAEIKNPRPYIQNNRAQYQQVNNGEQPQSRGELSDIDARTEKNKKSTNGLLEDKHNETEWLDTGTSETTSGNDKQLETVGTKHGAKE